MIFQLNQYIHTFLQNHVCNYDTYTFIPKTSITIISFRKERTTDHMDNRRHVGIQRTSFLMNLWNHWPKRKSRRSHPHTLPKVII